MLGSIFTLSSTLDTIDYIPLCTWGSISKSYVARHQLTQCKLSIYRAQAISADSTLKRKVSYVLNEPFCELVLTIMAANPPTRANAKTLQHGIL